jgi:hypothetical protein
MAGGVCGLTFNLDGTYGSPATGPGNPDGEIHALGFDAGQIIKYNLNSDFTYATGGSTSGNFTGLVPGTYTVYARSNGSCLKTISITIDWVKTYAPLYRIEFNDDRGDGQFKYRFDIEDYTFFGDVTVLDEYGAEPIELSWRGESNQNIWTGIISSEVRLTLLTKEDQQFIGLWTANDRRYRGRLFLYDDSLEEWVIKWVGFMTPQLYSEPYILKENYYNVFIFTDQLATLNTVQFSDDGGAVPDQRISLANVIFWCLHKTDIDIEVWENFNYRQYSMPKPYNESRLERIFIDPSIYVDPSGEMADCLTILTAELENLGCRLMQADGHWQVDHIPYKAGSAVMTRKYVFDGGSISADPENYRVELRRGGAEPPRLAFVERTGQMNISPIYGKVTVVWDLGLSENNNMLTHSDFNDEDYVNGQLKGWQLDTSNAPTIKDSQGDPFYRIEKVDNITSLQANMFVPGFFFPPDPLDPGAVPTPFSVNENFIISSNPIPISAAPANTILDLKINLKMIPLSGMVVDYLFIDVSVMIDTGSNRWVMQRTITDGKGHLTFLLDGPNTTLVDDEWTRVYVTDFDDFKELEFKMVLPSPPITGDLQVRIRVQSNPLFEFPSLYYMTDILTNTDTNKFFDNGDKKKRAIAGPLYPDLQGQLFYYEWEYTSEPQDVPNIIYSGTGSAPGYAWILKKTVNYVDLGSGNPYGADLLSSVSIDSVILKYMPGGNDPKSSIEQTVIIDPDNKIPETVQLKHADLSEGDINYKNISKAYYSLSDGTPTTETWTDQVGLGLPPFKSWIQSVARWHVGQHSFPRWRLTGSMDHDGVLPSLSNIIHEIRTGRLYLPMEMTLLLRSRLLSTEMIEILKGVAGEDNPDVEPPAGLGDFAAVDFKPDDFYAI